ncbi:nucleoside-diphosphate sugar epimerase/dehydratase [Bacillus sp. FJAT-49736]|uniref:polysaccharide biosynthesis protein n=1 Tax=Bacillus sp. FJAT-49736 TaxID=2833582 RepID=UPI0024B52927|nr:nucleoside-diphosphate sugar epimerase/dehydratase [Bacillus sp. FJAT-49736]
MTYHQRMSFFAVIDSFIVLTAIFLSRFLVTASFYVVTIPILISSIVLLISHHFFSFRFKLYKKAWEYASVDELLIICKSVTFSVITAGLVQKLINHEIFFRVLVVTWLLNILLIGGSRYCWRIIGDNVLYKVQNKKRTLIIGAGAAGLMVARQLKRSKDAGLLPVGFIDDDKKKMHLDILGIPVLGKVPEIERIVKEKNIDHIIIAIPSLKKRELTVIFNECLKTNAKTQLLPMIEDLLTGKVSINHFRDVKVEDLLGRDPVELDIESISENITDKTILVTGAGGSIGSEICRQISNFAPKKLILLGHGENSIYTINLELQNHFSHTFIDYIPVIGDLNDLNKLMSIMKTYKPDVVYHAAAHKHVPLMEKYPEEAVKNNLIGTVNLAKAASSNNVETFVMISTDKAVNPTSVMGASKRLAEMMVQYFDTVSETKFVAVRFGNVLGSRGSVVPLFKKQIENGGPVTVTHPDMVRYFMTIPEASRLVIQAGSLSKGGEIFVLDMGEPVKIVDLAKNLIKLSGYNEDEIDITFTGIRAGEKLYEELLQKDEVYEQKIYPNIYIGKTSNIYINEIEDIMTNFLHLDKEELKRRLLDLANSQKIDHAILHASI